MALSQCLSVVEPVVRGIRKILKSISPKKRKREFVCAGDNLPKITLRFKSVKPITPFTTNQKLQAKRELQWLEKSSQQKITLFHSLNKKAS